RCTASVPQELARGSRRGGARIIADGFQDAKEQGAELRRICEGSRMTAEPAQRVPASTPAEATGRPVSSEGPTHGFFEREPKPQVSSKRRLVFGVAFAVAIYAVIGVVLLVRRSNQVVEVSAVTPVMAAPAPRAEAAFE